MGGRAGGENDLWDAEPSRQQMLRAIKQHPLGNKRKLTIGRQEIVDRLVRLEAVAPHFGEALGLIRRAVVLSMRTEVGLAIQPQI